jgi:hypothetical protein
MLSKITVENPWRYLLEKTSKLILRSIDIEISIDRRHIRGISHCLGFDADSAIVIRVHPE